MTAGELMPDRLHNVARARGLGEHAHGEFIPRWDHHADEPPALTCGFTGYAGSSARWAHSRRRRGDAALPGEGDADGRSQVAAVGGLRTRRSSERPDSDTPTHAKPPLLSFIKKNRRVTVYYSQSNTIQDFFTRWMARLPVPDQAAGF
jgi:hypothetical protein